MKQYTSNSLKTIAILYFIFPVIFLVFAGVFFEISVHRVFSLLLSPLFYVVSASMILLGFGLWEMKRGVWFLLWPANVLVFYLSAVVMVDYSESNFKGFALFSTICILITLAYRVHREIRVPYFLPKIRWWESSTKYRLSVPVILSIQRQDATPISLEGFILDLSQQGCFVKCPIDIGAHEKVMLSFRVFGLPIHCRGLVVWKTLSTVTRPKGFGVKFQGLDRPLRRRLRIATERLKRIPMIHKYTKRITNPREFLRVLNDLQTPQRDLLKRTIGVK